MVAYAESVIAKEESLKMVSALLVDDDDISDIDVEDVAEELHKTMNAKPVRNKRRSIFNTTLDLNESRPVYEGLYNAFKAYKDHLAREKQVWKAFTKSNFTRSQELKTEQTSYKPSNDQQAFLNEGPNLQSFIRGMGAFMNDSNQFLIDYEEMQELHQDLRETCKFHKDRSQRNNIFDALSKS